MAVESYLQPADDKHSDMVDSFAFMVATQMAKIQNDYFLLHIKQKPKWLPNFIYRWIIGKVIVLNNFK